MNPHEIANRDVPPELRREITRYGGLNPFAAPLWRVVWAENIREQCFGSMRHMPRIDAALDMETIMAAEPERFESGEMWIPRYSSKGAILERWFPADAWGGRYDWESETAEDGQTRLKGEWPRHGDYFMVGDDFHLRMPPVDFWKAEIQREIYRQAHAPTDPGTYLATCLHIQQASEEARREAFLEEVNQIHRGTVEPLLATVGRTAQMVRDRMAAEIGLQEHLAAG